MTEKTYIYEYSQKELNDLEDIELKSIKKASELNDKLLDVKILIDEIDYDWKEFIDFLEHEKISKVTEFRGEECIDFNEELLNAIINTLKKSLDDAHKSMNYNSKKISLNLVLDG
ncbi:hypothetical protein [Methanobrevibacter sp.]|uniref:hypothetical protein n=1 Tax=Methanobrevibacter sp. TaxID=66852 RepID=UPI0025F980C0|nr:hypothetical protein [Methanobrevibacter sp.]MBR4448465.1 hypothetical protein [Methanobrevibacter sp.]